jgi:hypothetical protein
VQPLARTIYFAESARTVPNTSGAPRHRGGSGKTAELLRRPSYAYFCQNVTRCAWHKGEVMAGIHIRGDIWNLLDKHQQLRGRSREIRYSTDMPAASRKLMMKRNDALIPDSLLWAANTHGVPPGTAANPMRIYAGSLSADRYGQIGAWA